MRTPLELPPGLFTNDTAYAASGRWADASNVRFFEGRPQTIGGWESLTSSTLVGVCRNTFNWTDRAAVLNYAFGATSSLNVFLGGALYDITPVGLTPGSVDGTGGTGYGTGVYSAGAYSEPSASDYFPRTWALAAWGENLLASPRGGTIYAWTNNTATPAAALANAPANISHMLVAPQDQAFALGCNEEVSGDFNPLCIRHSSVRDNTEWDTASDTTAREYILPGGGRIVGGRVVGNYLLVWTSHALFLGTFVGSLTQPWRFDQVGLHCGLIGPNAAIVVGQAAFWIGPDLQFYRYGLGGEAAPIDCPIRDDFAENLTASQFDKITAASTSAFSEIRFDYPDSRDGLENSRYLTLSMKDGSWSRGIMSRTAYADAGPAPFPTGVTADGKIYLHERGNSANGAPFSWFIETADTHLDDEKTMMARGLYPDIKGQLGAVYLNITTRLNPQDPNPVSYGPYGISPGQEKVDFRATGRLFRMRLSGGSSPTACRIGKPVFDTVQTGGR